MKAKTTLEVLGELKILQKELKNLHLGQVEPFNWAYIVITKNVATVLNTRIIQNAHVLGEIDVKFAELYFDSLAKFGQNQPSPVAWNQLFSHPSRFKLINLTLGVNAHINNDLPQALLAVNPGAGFKADYDSLNLIMDQSIAEIIAGIYLDSPMRLVVGRLGWFFISRLIRVWRARVWEQYIAGQSMAEIEKRAGERAIKLSHGRFDLLISAK